MSKKINVILGVILLLSAVQTVFGSTILYEDFEATTFPPAGWDTVKTGTCRAWVRRTSGQVFRTGASAGICIANYAPWGSITGTSCLRTNALNFSSSGIEFLSFYFRCPSLTVDSFAFGSRLDTLKVEVSTNGTVWTPVLTIDSNYIRSLPNQMAILDTGYKQTVSLAGYNGQTTVYIRWILYDNWSGNVGTNRYFNMDSIYVYDVAPAIEELGGIRPVSSTQLISNPNNNLLTIKYNFPNTQEVQLKIFDCVGNLVSTFTDRITTEGLNTLNFNLSSFEAGVYFYNIEQNDKNICNGKFVIVR